MQSMVFKNNYESAEIITFTVIVLYANNFIPPQFLPDGTTFQDKHLD